MDSKILIVLNILVMLVITGILYYMQKKYVSFTKRVFTAMGLGILFGGILQFFYGAESFIVKESANWFSIIGVGYVKLLKMIVIPLIMVSIISAIVNVKSSKGLGKKTGTIIGGLILTTVIAALIAIFTTNIFGLSADSIEASTKEISQGQKLEEKLVSLEEGSIPNRVLEMLPENPFMDMTGQRATSTIAVVVFSAFVGVAALQIKKKKPKEAQTFVDIINSFQAVVMRIVTLVLRLTPFGVAALMTNNVATTDINGLISLGKFVLVSYIAIILMFIIHLIIVTVAGFNPITYIKKAIPTLTFAFTARSSAASLPFNIETQTEEFGVSEEIASLSASFGTTMGQNGCAGVYPAMLAVMIAPVIGINPLSPTFIIQLLVIIAISSFGVAGVGGGATFAALIVLSSMDLPVGLAGLLISVEPLIDMARTALNVNGSMTVGLVTGKIFNEVNKKRFNTIDKPLNK